MAKEIISFGKRIRECRDAKGLSQQELGKLMKTTFTAIGKYERDEMIPSVVVAKRLGNFFGYYSGLFTWRD